MDSETGKMIASLIAIGDESVGRTLTEDELKDAKTRIREVFERSGKKHPRKPRHTKPEHPKNT
ncbi:hypothetical protein [Vibrio crassostreae]|uniref:hypothetical protein n=1 Tax=Vibrio crassostreae TaxID=246167 RepID=UPI001B3102CF|nr:hypothetical protein [Vibrio crassostreae]